MSDSLVLNKFYINLNFKNKTKLEQKQLAQLETELRTYYDSCSRTLDFPGLILFSKTRCINLFITEKVINYENTDGEIPYTKRFKEIIDEWHIITDLMSISGEIQITITGLFQCTGIEDVNFSNIVTWNPHIVEVFNGKEKSYGKMIEIQTEIGEILLSLVLSKEDDNYMQFSKKASIETGQVAEFLIQYSKDIDSKFKEALNYI